MAQHPVYSASLLPFPVAAPSWVLAGDVIENCRFLTGKVEEVGLCLFEAQACLAYPSSMWNALAGLSLAYHLHLPLDLDWTAGAAGICLELTRRAQPLTPTAYVLHAPPSREALRDVAAAWAEAGFPIQSILLENTLEVSLEHTASLAYELGMGLCLDLGHLLLSGETPTALMLERCRLLHLSCPEVTGRGHRHLSLEKLSSWGMALCDVLLTGAPQARRMVEVFDWEALVRSVAWLRCRDSERKFYKAGVCIDSS